MAVKNKKPVYFGSYRVRAVGEKIYFGCGAVKIPKVLLLQAGLALQKRGFRTCYNRVIELGNARNQYSSVDYARQMGKVRNLATFGNDLKVFERINRLVGSHATLSMIIDTSATRLLKLAKLK